MNIVTGEGGAKHNLRYRRYSPSEPPHPSFCSVNSAKCHLPPQRGEGKGAAAPVRIRPNATLIADLYCRRAEVCPPYDGQYNLMTPQKQFNPSAEPTHFLFTFHSSLFSVKKEIFDFFFNNVYALFSLLLSTFYGTIKCKTSGSRFRRHAAFE